MSLALSLVSIFGKPLADSLLKRLTAQKNGAEKLEQAAVAMTKGMTAVEALSAVFGKTFQQELNTLLSNEKGARFSYEANTQKYIRLDSQDLSKIRILRDELNINLDRLALSKSDLIATRNQFRGLMAVWQGRCREYFYASNSGDIDATFKKINSLLDDRFGRFGRTIDLLKRICLGVVGGYLILVAALTITSTGVGIVKSVSRAIFGIPWLKVGVLLLSGSLLMFFSRKRINTADHISISIALAYDLLDRIDEGAK